MGRCDICGETVELKVRDELVNFAVGDCCSPSLRLAHALLDGSFMQLSGPRHPYVGEFRDHENH
jgi:hypothetical protein